MDPERLMGYTGQSWPFPATPAMQASIALVLLLSGLGSARKDKSQLVLHIKALEDCNRPSTPNRMNMTIINIGKGMTVINADYDVKVPFPRGKFKFILYRCETACERSLMFSTDYCKVFVEKGMPWTRFAETAHPEMKCPVKKGIYRFVNATLDASEITKTGLMTMPPWMEHYEWRSEFHVYNHKDEMLSCGKSIITFSREVAKKRF